MQCFTRFEPVTNCYDEPIANFKDDPKFKGFNLALGNKNGPQEINRNEFSASSSFLPMAELHKQSFPFTQRELGVERVFMRRLDDLEKELVLERPILVKLDVQGFEGEAIIGGKNVIGQAKIIIIEMPVETLYDGQPLFHDIYKMLVDLGFQYRGNYDQLCSPNDGRVLQIDGIFIKQ